MMRQTVRKDPVTVAPPSFHGTVMQLSPDVALQCPEQFDAVLLLLFGQPVDIWLKERGAGSKSE